MTSGAPGTRATAKSSMRPPVFAGPMLRQRRAAISAGSMAPPPCAATRGWPASITSRKAKQTESVRTTCINSSSGGRGPQYTIGVLFAGDSRHEMVTRQPRQYRGHARPDWRRRPGRYGRWRLSRAPRAQLGDGNKPVLAARDRFADSVANRRHVRRFTHVTCGRADGRFCRRRDGRRPETWARILGNRYERTKVVLFRDAIQSACGFAEAATGPFYCPGDRKVYLDLGFFNELDRRFGAPGDFAQAYVVAHELGHHIQSLLGLMDRGMRDRQGAQSASVALELQADCFAGVWGHAASQGGRFQAGHVELEPGDANEALRAAASIGDDRLQKMATGRVMPDRFTHGSSAQRVDWFRRGMDSG